jgi:hypothetical protein
VYNLYSGNPNITSAQARQRFSATVNAPLELGDALLALALEDNTTDSSPYANTMTANNSPGTVAAVFGNGYSSTVSSYLSRTDTDFNAITCATDVGGYMHYWFKTASTTNPAADAELVAVDRSTGADSFRMYISTGGLLVGYFYDTVASSNPVGNTDFADAKWHHVVWTVDCGTNLGSMYVDGVLHVSAAYTGTSGLGLNVVQIGAKEGPSGYFDGFIDDVVIGAGTVSAESAAKLHAEGRKKLDMGTPVFTSTTDDALISNNVVEVDALDNGIWAVAFSDANTVQVFDGRIPVQEIAAPAGTVKSFALIQSPGADSVGVAIGTTTNLKFVQPSVNLRAAMAHQYKEPIYVGSPVVVDSAGIGGIFWTVNDALDAGVNAGRHHTKIGVGTYGPFTVDLPNLLIEGSGWGMNNAVQDKEGTTITSTTANPISISTTAQYCIIRDLTAYTLTGGGGGGYGPIVSTAASFNQIQNVFIPDSDANGIQFIGGSYNIVSECFIYGADANSVQVNGPVNTVVNSFLLNAGSHGIQTDGTGDDSIFNGNTIQDHGSSSIYTTSGADDVVCSGNRLDGAVGGAGCTDGNDTSAF